MDDWDLARDILIKGGVAILPTDTIYGIHCLTTNKAGVERIYKLKGRDSSKPFIILISNLDDLGSFGIVLDDALKLTLKDYWPGPNSIILPVIQAEFSYLHRGTASLAFRLPNYPPLLNLLKQTGPLVSTSANPSGNSPASDITIAKAYFGNKVNYYLDAGRLDNSPSKVYKLENKIVGRVR